MVEAPPIFRIGRDHDTPDPPVAQVAGQILCRLSPSYRLEAISRTGAPRYLSSAHGPLSRYHRWQVNLRALDIHEVKTLPYAALSQPFVERLIGTLRRAYLDPFFFWNIVDLERKLANFQVYLNRSRVNWSPDGDTPAAVSGNSVTSRAELHNFRWQTHCRGLYQLPVAA